MAFHYMQLIRWKHQPHERCVVVPTAVGFRSHLRHVDDQRERHSHFVYITDVLTSARYVIGTSAMAARARSTVRSMSSRAWARLGNITS